MSGGWPSTAVRCATPGLRSGPSSASDQIAPVPVHFTRRALRLIFIILALLRNRPSRLKTERTRARHRRELSDMSSQELNDPGIGRGEIAALPGTAALAGLQRRGGITGFTFDRQRFNGHHSHLVRPTWPRAKDPF